MSVSGKKFSTLAEQTPIIPSMRPADRLFQIVLELGRGRVLTAAFLAEKFEVSARTIYRDIQDLMVSGIPVDGEPGVGYRLHRGYQVPPMMFDQQELQALVFGAQVAKAWGDKELADAADQILAKVDAVLPEKLRPELLSQAVVAPDLYMTDELSESLGGLRQAVNAQQRVLISYTDKNDEASERIVWPLTLLYWGKSWTLGTWCELRQDFRTFRVDRVSYAQPLKTKIPEEPGKTLDDYFAHVGRKDPAKDDSQGGTINKAGA